MPSLSMCLVAFHGNCTVNPTDNGQLCLFLPPSVWRIYTFFVKAIIAFYFKLNRQQLWFAGTLPWHTYSLQAHPLIKDTMLRQSWTRFMQLWQVCEKQVREWTARPVFPKLTPITSHVRVKCKLKVLDIVSIQKPDWNWKDCYRLNNTGGAV